MTEKQLQQYLCDLLTKATLDNDDGQEGIDRVSTFAEAGVLLANAGVVVCMKDRRQFQITIVRSR